MNSLLNRGTEDLLPHRRPPHLALTFFACYIGLAVFPVAGPVFDVPSSYPHPLARGIFTQMGEWTWHTSTSGGIGTFTFHRSEGS